HTLPRARFAYGKQLPWLKDGANQEILFSAVVRGAGDSCGQRQPEVALSCRQRDARLPARAQAAQAFGRAATVTPLLDSR
ncbi:hypothetical protein, partial [Xanthomonas oryzae]